MKKILLFFTLSAAIYGAGNSDISVSSSSKNSFGETKDYTSYQNMNFYAGENFSVFSNSTVYNGIDNENDYNIALAYIKNSPVFSASLGYDKHGSDYNKSESYYTVVSSSASFSGVKFSPEITAVNRELFESKDSDIRFKYSLEKNILSSISLFNSAEFSIDTDNSSDLSDHSYTEFGAKFNKITTLSYINGDIAIGKNDIKSREMTDIFIRSDFNSKHYLKQNIAIRFDNYFNSELDSEGAFSNKSILRGEYIIGYAGKDSNKCYLYTSYNRKGDFTIVRNCAGGDWWIFEPIKSSIDIFKKESEINSSKGVNLLISYYLTDKSSFYLTYEKESFDKSINGIDSSDSISFGTNVSF